MEWEKCKKQPRCCLDKIVFRKWQLKWFITIARSYVPANSRARAGYVCTITAIAITPHALATFQTTLCSCQCAHVSVCICARICCNGGIDSRGSHQRSHSRFSYLGKVYTIYTVMYIIEKRLSSARRTICLTV